jgi:hypothetical protein
MFLGVTSNESFFVTNIFSEEGSKFGGPSSNSVHGIGYMFTFVLNIVRSLGNPDLGEAVSMTGDGEAAGDGDVVSFLGVGSIDQKTKPLVLGDGDAADDDACTGGGGACADSLITTLLLRLPKDSVSILMMFSSR